MGGWMKTGAASQQLAEQEAIEALKRKEEQGKMFRFYLKTGEEARITFVDGALNKDGYLTPPRFYEHTIQVAGKWEEYVCPEKTNPESGDKCPICASGDRPYLVSLFTVIDHREFKSKDGSKTYSDMPRLLALKPKGFEIVAHKAKKQGGLEGRTFDVARLGENATNTGDVWDFVEKKDIAELQAQFMRNVKDDKGNDTGKKETYFVQADYEEEIVFRTGDELRAMGLGVASAGGSTYSSANKNTGYVPPSQQYKDDNSATAGKDYSNEL